MRSTVWMVLVSLLGVTRVCAATETNGTTAAVGYGGSGGSSSSGSSGSSYKAGPFETHKHVGEYVVMVFPILALLVGVGSKQLLALWVHHLPNLPCMPYTPFLLIVGMFIEALDHYIPTYRHFAKSFDAWKQMDGHVLLYLFLPPLVFGDAMNLDFHIVKKCAFQCATLAFPGVALGATLFALVAKYLLPWDWDWCLCFAFGAVMSATDPVAVVSVLSELGAPPTITMIIGGESLLNDGAAMVMWTVFFYAYLGYEMGLAPTILMLFFGSMAIGAAFGYVWRYWLGKFASSLDHTNGVTQTALTIVGSYACFYVAEALLSASGVMAVVFMGAYLSYSFWPVLANPALLVGTWHTLEWMMNTVLFLQAPHRK